MFDLSTVTASDLARWARARVALDWYLLSLKLVDAGVAVDGTVLDGGLNFATGTVAARDPLGTVYTLDEDGDLVVRPGVFAHTN